MCPHHAFTGDQAGSEIGGMMQASLGASDDEAGCFLKFVDATLVGCPLWVALDEKITDEYFAASKLFQVIQTLFTTIGREIPPEFQRLDIKPFAKDAFWRFLLYPLDGFKSRKPVYIPVESGPRWCWGGFVIPEIWFLWHEIWGASILAVITEAVIARFLVPEVGLYGILISMGFVRIIGGIFGHRIYYFRYGVWLGASTNSSLQGSR